MHLDEHSQKPFDGVDGRPYTGGTTPDESRRAMNDFARLPLILLGVLMAGLLAGSGTEGGDAATGGAKAWSITRRVTPQNEDILEIAYGSGVDFPQYAAFYLRDAQGTGGFLRPIHGRDVIWGTSIVALPSFWEQVEGEPEPVYHQGARIETVTWETRGGDLFISYETSISSLRVQGEIRLLPPGENFTWGEVRISVSGAVALAERPNEAFKPVMLSSMHLPDGRWDAESAYANSNSYPLPAAGWIIDPTVTGGVLGLNGGTSAWNSNAPTVEVTLDGPAMDITGWVTASSNPNDDNVGLWAATDEVLPSWSYKMSATPVDSDGDTLPNYSDPDDDNDGCADLQETAENPGLGGLRNPKNFWDFFDTPDANNLRDRAVTIGDVVRVVARFGTTGAPGDPLSPPPLTGYHTAYDRRPAGGNFSGPADGSVTIGDVVLDVAQFGHTCRSSG